MNLSLNYVIIHPNLTKYNHVNALIVDVSVHHHLSHFYNDYCYNAFIVNY